MAVEIVPKPKAKPNIFFNVVFYLSLVFVVLTVGAYLGLYRFEQQESQKLEELKDQLAHQETKELKELRRDLVEDEKKVKEFAILLESYRYGSNFFGFLQEITHPKINWVDTHIDLETYKLTLSGRAESFTVLTQQILFLERDPRVAALDLTNLTLTEDRTVNFGLELSLSPNLFK